MRGWRLALSFRIFSVILGLATPATFLAQPAAAQANAEPKRVITLHSFGLRFKPWTDYAEMLRSEMFRQSKAPIDFQDHSLLTARVDDDKALAPLVHYLQALYADKPPDLIVALGAPAAEFVQRYRAQLFPATPMLITAVEARRVQYDKLTENDAVAAVAHDFPVAFATILKVLPDTKLIAVVNGASPNEAFWQGVFERELAPLRGRIELRWYNRMSFEDILKDAAKLPPHSAIFWHLMSVDAAGVAHESNTALSRLSAVADAPIFSYLDVFFGSSIVGGSMHSVQHGMAIAAAAAIRILNGEKAGDVKVAPTKFEAPAFDWRQMQRFGISESRLPPGSTVYFREPSAWEQYRWQIALVLTIIILQAGLISVLLHEHRRRRLAEVQSRQRMSELAHVNRFSTAGELTATLAHEINQPLSAILANAETAQIMLEAPRPDIAELKQIVDDILHDDRRAGEVIRRMRSLLKKAPFELKKIDLNEVARETVVFFSMLTVARDIALTGPAPEPLPIQGDGIQLQQVIINLVVNAMDAMAETAGSRSIAIRTARDAGFAELSVTDSGPGIAREKLGKVFDPFFTSKAEGMGMGLSIARTIVEAHQGQMWAENQAGSGASFRIRLPLAA
jgi:signal transduction histidine kinase